MTTNLKACRCGGVAKLGDGANRKRRRQEAEAALQEAQALAKQPNVEKDAFAKLSAAATLLISSKESDREAGKAMVEQAKRMQRLGSRRGLEEAEAVVKALAADVHEVTCPKCHSFVWGTTAEEAAGRWNRAVERLASLKDCCKQAKDRRVDHDGMVIVRCETCGSKHFPLDPKQS